MKLPARRKVWAISRATGQRERERTKCDSLAIFLQAIILGNNLPFYVPTAKGALNTLIWPIGKDLSVSIW